MCSKVCLDFWSASFVRSWIWEEWNAKSPIDLRLTKKKKSCASNLWIWRRECGFTGWTWNRAHVKWFGPGLQAGRTSLDGRAWEQAQSIMRILTLLCAMVGLWGSTDANRNCPDLIVDSCQCLAERSKDLSRQHVRVKVVCDDVDLMETLHPSFLPNRTFSL